MHQHFGTAPSPSMHSVDENLILVEIEGLLGNNWSDGGQNDGSLAVSAAARRGPRSVPLLVAAGLVVVAALVPFGLKKGGAIGAARQAMSDARGAVSD